MPPLLYRALPERLRPGRHGWPVCELLVVAVVAVVVVVLVLLVLVLVLVM